MHEFRGVVVAPATEAEFRVRFVELEADGVWVHFTVEGEASARVGETNPARASLEAFRGLGMTDDRATEYSLANDLLDAVQISDGRETTYEYRKGGGSGSPGLEYFRGEVFFVPGVPAEAQKLIVTTPDGETALDLQAAIGPAR